MTTQALYMQAACKHCGTGINLDDGWMINNTHVCRECWTNTAVEGVRSHIPNTVRWNFRCPSCSGEEAQHEKEILYCPRCHNEFTQTSDAPRESIFCPLCNQGIIRPVLQHAIKKQKVTQGMWNALIKKRDELIQELEHVRQTVAAHTVHFTELEKLKKENEEIRLNNRELEKKLMERQKIEDAISLVVTQEDPTVLIVNYRESVEWLGKRLEQLHEALQACVKDAQYLLKEYRWYNINFGDDIVKHIKAIRDHALLLKDKSRIQLLRDIEINGPIHPKGTIFEVDRIKDGKAYVGIGHGVEWDFVIGKDAVLLEE